MDTKEALNEQRDRLEPLLDVQPLIEVKDCTMEFPGVRALDHVSFTLLPGECHGLVGENGAGKSTLAKCIIGENHMTQGKLVVNGEPIKISSYSIRDSQSRGISIVHQEFQLMNDMTGLENIFIGHYEQKGPFIDWKALRKRAAELMKFLQTDVNLNIPVKRLRTAERQIVQLAKAVLNESNILILDELTAVLQEKDIDNIFRIINILKNRGMGIIYISHRLGEIFDICDTYTVLCDGKHISTGNVEDIDKPQLIKMIIGRELSQVYPPINDALGDVVLEVKNISSPDVFRDISFKVRQGEVIGIAGLLGAGKTELIHALFGNYKLTEGKVFINGKEVHIHNPMEAIKLGFGLIPDERRELGLNLMFDIKDNTTLPSMPKFRKWRLFQDHKAETKAAYNFNERMDLAYYSLWQNVTKLSGGNQQKIVLAKWMLRNCDIFLMDEPTRGIDVGAKFEIYTLINELTKQGKAVVLVSPELEELMGLCHRVYIIFEGSMMDVVEGERKTQEVIIKSLLGINDDESNR
jgi:ABC-type sugar transport system ATPase subunit